MNRNVENNDGNENCKQMTLKRRQILWAVGLSVVLILGFSLYRHFYKLKFQPAPSSSPSRGLLMPSSFPSTTQIYQPPASTSINYPSRHTYLETASPIRAPIESTRPCQRQCENNTLQWIAGEGELQKYNYINNCVGCLPCVEERMKYPCEEWCASNPNPWITQRNETITQGDETVTQRNKMQKCNWKDGCAGCGECF